MARLAGPVALGAAVSAVVVRVPVPADAEALARLQLDCWREAYADLTDPARLAPHLADVETAVARWHQTLAGPARRRLTLGSGSRSVYHASVVNPRSPWHIRRGHGQNTTFTW